MDKTYKYYYGLLGYNKSNEFKQGLLMGFSGTTENIKIQAWIKQKISEVV